MSCQNYHQLPFRTADAANSVPLATSVFPDYNQIPTLADQSGGDTAQSTTAPDPELGVKPSHDLILPSDCTEQEDWSTKSFGFVPVTSTGGASMSKPKWALVSNYHASGDNAYVLLKRHEEFHTLAHEACVTGMDTRTMLDRLATVNRVFMTDTVNPGWKVWSDPAEKWPNLQKKLDDRRTQWDESGDLRAVLISEGLETGSSLTGGVLGDVHLCRYS